MPNILHIGTFCGIDPVPNFWASTPSTDWILADGFRKLGYSVYEVNCLGYASRAALADINAHLNIREYEFALFGNVFLGMGVFARMILRKCRTAGVPVVIWHGDIRQTLEKQLVHAAGMSDFLFMTTGGKRLIEYKLASKVPVAAYMFNPAYNYPETIKDESRGRRFDLLFAGGKSVDSTVKAADPLRDSIMAELPAHADRNGYTIYTPGYEQQRITGRDYIKAIRQAWFGLGINRFTEFEKYTSDRMCQFMANGCFYICNQNPGLENMFRDGEHLFFFKDKKGCFEAIEIAMIMPPAERTQIAKAGQAHILNEFGNTVICKYMIDVIKTGKSDRSWAEVYI